MNHRYGWLSAVLGLVVCVSAAFADDKKETPAKEEAKFTAKCPVSGADAKKEQSAKYKEKDVYFCCEKCKAAFEGDAAKYATKANHQLVQTKQFKQTTCPLSGGKVSKEQHVKVDGVKVTFCCDKCKGAIESASKEDQLTKIFAEEVFAKSFTAKKKADAKDKEEAEVE
jgi:YHS domain-containing protein